MNKAKTLLLLLTTLLSTTTYAMTVALNIGNNTSQTCTAKSVQQGFIVDTHTNHQLPPHQSTNIIFKALVSMSAETEITCGDYSPMTVKLYYSLGLIESKLIVDNSKQDKNSPISLVLDAGFIGERSYTQFGDYVIANLSIQ